LAMAGGTGGQNSGERGRNLAGEIDEGLTMSPQVVKMGPEDGRRGVPGGGGSAHASGGAGELQWTRRPKEGLVSFSGP
jgi:hypothetical protein